MSEAHELIGGPCDKILMKAVIEGQRRGVEALLKGSFLTSKFDSTISQKGLNDAVREAAVKGKRKISSMLLEFGAAVEIERNGRLVYEAQMGNLEEVERLIDLGADVRGSKNLALVMAIYHNQIHVALELCRRGADIWEAVQGQGVTAMEKIAAGGPAYENMRNFVSKTLHATKPVDARACEMPEI